MCGATCDLNHIMTTCTHFGERSSVDDVGKMDDRSVQSLNAVADTICDPSVQNQSHVAENIN